MRIWKLPTPTRIVDKLKSNLLGEMASAEWELLEEKEWDDAVMDSPQPSVPQSPKAMGSQFGSVETERTSKTRSRTQGQDASSSRPKGTKGWTKVADRGHGAA